MVNNTKTPRLDQVEWDRVIDGLMDVAKNIPPEQAKMQKHYIRLLEMDRVCIEDEINKNSKN